MIFCYLGCSLGCHVKVTGRHVSKYSVYYKLHLQRERLLPTRWQFDLRVQKLFPSIILKRIPLGEISHLAEIQHPSPAAQVGGAARHICLALQIKSEGEKSSFTLNYWQIMRL